MYWLSIKVQNTVFTKAKEIMQATNWINQLMFVYIDK